MSLGLRWEVAFQLRLHSGDSTAQVFDWMALPAQGLIEILRKDFDVFAPEQLYLVDTANGQLVADRGTGVRFHHSFEHPAHYLADYAGFIARFRHLAERFRQQAKTEAITYVRRDMSEAQALDLEKAYFERYPNTDVRFLYLNDRIAPFSTAHGQGVFFAPESHFGDAAAWAEILTEEKLIGEPYRLAPIDILAHEPEGRSLMRLRGLTAEQLETAMESNPDNPGFPYELARQYRLQGLMVEAEAAIALALRKSPDHPAMRREGLAIRRAANRMSERAYADALLEMGAQDDAEATMMAADALAAIQEYEAAAQAYGRYLSLHPMDAGACYGKAACLRRLNRFSEAEMAITLCLQLAPDMARAHVLRSQILLALSRHWDSIAAAQRACKSDPSPRGLYNLAAVYESLEQMEKAVEVYEEIERLGTHVNVKAVEKLRALRGEPLQAANQEPLELSKPATRSWGKRVFGAR
ncbi:tetratricopeptide repeat protein, partial [Asticcacaulis biprosthecium]|uniref:tetratricopeptide repeat protein n=1 Tax=Asticcacaulis biprosthecium TaxID=76891 RepID=UPI00145F6A27